MFCRNCGKQIHQKAIVCPGCGVPPLSEQNYCPHCGESTVPLQTMCMRCGGFLARGGALGPGNSDKIAAGLFGIFLGWLGIHKFYLGYNKEGVIMLLASVVGGVCTCFLSTAVISVIGFVEGIIYLTKTDEDFRQDYILGRRTWF